MSRTILVLHGGLGNQLFQLLAAETFARQTGSELVIYDGVLGRYAAPHVVELGPLLPDLPQRLRLTLVERSLARARMPKILARLTGRERILRLGPSWIADGYFQEPPARDGAVGEASRRVLERWRRCLSLPPPCPDRSIHHIRLRDFFRDRAAATAHAESRVRNAGPGAFISDDDDLLRPVLERHGRAGDLVESAGWSAWETLTEMARHGTIRTNGSTLAVWAAVLARCLLDSSVPWQMAFVRATAPGLAGALPAAAPA